MVPDESPGVVERRSAGAYVYDSYRVQRADGQVVVRQRTTCLTDGTQSFYERPVYPDHPTVVRVPVNKDEEKPPVPPPSLPAREVDPQHPSLPRSLTSVYQLAVEHGWRARFMFAVGPHTDQYGNVDDPHLRTMTLRCVRGTERVVFCWEWHEGGWRIPSKARVGAYVAPWQPGTQTAAKGVLKGGG